MNKLITLLLFLSTTATIEAQSIEELEMIEQNLVKRSISLSNQTKEVNDSLTFISKQIRLAKAKEIGIEPQKYYINEMVTLEGFSPLRIEPLNSSKSILNAGNKEVFVIELLNEYWAEIRYDNQTYFASIRNIPQTDKIKEALSKIALDEEALMEQKMKDVEKERIEREGKPEEERLEWEKGVEEEWKRKDALKKKQQEEWERKDVLKKKQQEARYQERKSLLIKKYGTANGTKMAEGVIWIDMTSDMVTDSWGEPSDKNITLSSYGKREQWVYGTGRYVYIENGIVTTIQN